MLALFALALMALAGCERKPETIRIGVAGPITGSYAKFGEQLVKGAQAAVAALNAAGGVEGKTLELVTGDDACDAKQARAVANKLVNEKVVAVVGHFCSSSTIPASEVYDEANILQITPASTNPKVTERGLAVVFRTCGRDDQQGDVAADYIATVLKARRVAVVHDKDTYGQGLADAMKARLNATHKLKEVLYEGITRGSKDFNALITKIKGLRVDVIYFGGLHTEAGLLVRQAREQGLKAILFSGDGIVTEDFPSIAGPATEGVMMTFGSDPRLIPEAAQAVAAIRATGYEPEAYTLYSYATVQVIAAALKANAISRDGRKLAATLKANTFQTVMGPKAFDAKGDLKQTDYVVYRWKKTGADKYDYAQVK
ncbi:MAG: branched-chain amino acid ABC transporter substrate-binding protein [Candidatus Lambdaproteobacteria bacterium]|nr:branched-chain amino acid ABC transporter substrate-binding protein [Candidatus Lambdaproteobacteria bacterium]